MRSNTYTIIIVSIYVDIHVNMCARLYYMVVGTYLFIIYSRAILLLGNIIWEHYMGNPIIIRKRRYTFIRDKSAFIILYLLLYK